jgi:hypothetical protein
MIGRVFNSRSPVLSGRLKVQGDIRVEVRERDRLPIASLLPSSISSNTGEGRGHCTASLSTLPGESSPCF